jgi:hypothetical protein
MAGLIGGFLGLLLGLCVVLVFQTLVYPGWRMAHERAKVTASHGTDPSKVGIIVRAVAFILFPLLGIALGFMLSRP